MGDLTRMLTMIFGIVIFIIIGIGPLTKFISKAVHISAQDAFNVVILLVNLLAVLVMVVTIFVNNKSSMEQIEAINVATQRYITKLEEFDKDSKKALISAFVVEYKNNIKIMKSIVERETILTNKTDPSFCEDRFSFEAYQANLNNATIDDSVLLDKIVQVCNGIKAMQGFLDTARNPDINNETRVYSSAKAISNIKTNLEKMEQLCTNISDYKERKY